MGLVGIVDIGLGNVDSVGRAAKRVGHDFLFCHIPQDLDSVGKIIFPGVGSYGEASGILAQTGFRDALRLQVLENRKPILGICLGMQLLGERGTEGGGGIGLGLVPGTVELHRGISHGVRLPHIGWNNVSNPGGVLYEGLPESPDFYFVHSYEFLSAGQLPPHAGICNYGVDFVASFESGIICGTQFHPEKSQSDGLKLLDNFIRSAGC